MPAVVTSGTDFQKGRKFILKCFKSKCDNFSVSCTIRNSALQALGIVQARRPSWIFSPCIHVVREQYNRCRCSIPLKCPQFWGESVPTGGGSTALSCSSSAALLVLHDFQNGLLDQAGCRQPEDDDACWDEIHRQVNIPKVYTIRSRVHAPAHSAVSVFQANGKPAVEEQS